MASLSYATAARIATRELQSSRGKFTFVMLSVAIGVAALTGVRGFSASFRSMLTLQARSIMAGDLSARTSQQATPDEAGRPGQDRRGRHRIYAGNGTHFDGLIADVLRPAAG